VGFCQIGGACSVDSAGKASGLSGLLFGNLVEANVASNETDASQLVERILEANCQKAAC
jgi:hypothetical protein